MNIIRLAITLSLLLAIFSPGQAYSQQTIGKIGIAYEQFNNSDNVSGDAIILDMKLLDPTLVFSGGLRYEKVEFPGYPTYYVDYIFIGGEKLVYAPGIWAYTEVGFKRGEFFHYWPVVYPDYYISLGARYRFQYFTVSAFGRITRIIDGVDIPSGTYASYGISLGFEIQ